MSIGKLVNAFFRWEFNSCETLVKGPHVHPIDYANASPDIAITSLHYFFPWAIKTLAKWCVFCAATGRPMRSDQDTRRYFDVADRDDLGYEEKLAEYRRMADEHFDTARYEEFCERHLGEVDEAMVSFVESDEFDRIVVDTVRSTCPAGEQEHFIAHYRGLLGAWVHDQQAS